MKTNEKYKIDITHEGDGWYDYNEELFKDQLPFLIQAINGAISFGISISSGETVFGTEATYYIKSVTYYINHVNIEVSEFQEDKLEL